MAKLTAKKIAKLIGTNDKENLAISLLQEYPAVEVVKVLLQMVEAQHEDDGISLNPQPSISVTAEEMEKISAIFRVKGTDGRGRKKKVQ